MERLTLIPEDLNDCSDSWHPAHKHSLAAHVGSRVVLVQQADFAHPLASMPSTHVNARQDRSAT